MNLFDGTDLLETTSTEIKNRILKPGQMLLLEAMGGGLTWGACVVRL